MLHCISALYHYRNTADWTRWRHKITAQTQRGPAPRSCIGPRAQVLHWSPHLLGPALHPGKFWFCTAVEDLKKGQKWNWMPSYIFDSIQPRFLHCKHRRFDSLQCVTGLRYPIAQCRHIIQAFLRRAFLLVGNIVTRAVLAKDPFLLR